MLHFVIHPHLVVVHEAQSLGLDRRDPLQMFIHLNVLEWGYGELITTALMVQLGGTMSDRVAILWELTGTQNVKARVRLTIHARHHLLGVRVVWHAATPPVRDSKSWLHDVEARNGLILLPRQNLASDEFLCIMTYVLTSHRVLFTVGEQACDIVKLCNALVG